MGFVFGWSVRKNQLILAQISSPEFLIESSLSVAAITEGVDCDVVDVDVVRRQETARRDSGSNGLSSNPGNMGEL